MCDSINHINFYPSYIYITHIIHVRNPACSPTDKHAEWNLLVSVSIVDAVIITVVVVVVGVVVVVVLVLVVIIMY